MSDFLRSLLAIVCGFFGAVVGAIVGYFLFFWLTGIGFYALVVPGAVTGFAAGLAAGRGSALLGIIAGAIALVAGVFTEWQFAPFHANKTFPYFLTHIAELKPITLIMIVVGTLLAGWLAARAGRG